MHHNLGFYYTKCFQNNYSRTKEIRDKDGESKSYLISEYLSSYFGLEILDTLTSQTCLKKKVPRLIVEEKMIISPKGIMPNSVRVQIHHENS